MRNNNLEDALVAIRRIMRVTEINSLALAKETKLTPTQMIVLQVIATTDEATPSFISNKMKSEKIIFLTDVEGILDHNKRLISKITKSQANELLKSGIISGGMIPKVKTCFKTLNKGVRGVALVDGRKENAILMELLTEKGAGTLIKK